MLSPPHGRHILPEGGAAHLPHQQLRSGSASSRGKVTERAFPPPDHVCLISHTMFTSAGEERGQLQGGREFSQPAEPEEFRICGGDPVATLWWHHSVCQGR